MSRFLKERYESLQPYTPGEQPQTQGLIKLNTNENPYAPSPKVMEIINDQEISKLMLYPDPSARMLVKAIADYYHVKQGQVAVGNGSDELLAFCFMAFQNGKSKFYFPAISYGFYPVYGEVFHADCQEIPLQEDLKINVMDYRNLDGNIVIANPNAPTGIALNLQEVEDILESNKSNLVIIDEAYIDFGAKSCVPFIEKYDNLLVIQTLSKSRSLAGSRVGFAVGNEAIISDLNRIKFSFNPYNLDRISILSATAAIKDEAHFEATRKKIIATRGNFVKEMTALGFTVLPSAANFVLVKSDKLSGADYFAQLRKNNILVRHFDKDPIADFVRITVGRDEDMTVLLKITKKLLQKG